MRMKHKSWSEPFLKDHPEIVKVIVHQEDVDFDFSHPTCLEIGTGRGDFIVQMAKKYPDFQWIGIEMNVDALAITAKKVVESGLKNIQLIRQNFIVIAPFFPSSSFNKIYLNFSDPWPKKRHAKRRLTADTFLNEYRRLLKNEGELVMKTDNYPLFCFSVEMLEQEKWNIISLESPYEEIKEEDAGTEYEMKFRSLHQPIYRLKAKR